ncbi:MAG: 4'-phosphopantetheinyl transferase superfamily protein [Pseudomonadota bacterium]
MTEKLGEFYNWLHTQPEQAPALAVGEVHVWQCMLKLNPQQHELALTFLNDTQRDKYARRATRELKHAYLAGRYFLMTLLAKYSGIAPQELMLSYSRLNKPYLNPNPLDLEFNFTDTMQNGENIGLFAFARNVAVGVDIECLERQSNAAAIVNRRFSDAEKDYVTNPEGDINQQRFLAYWTRKEAYGKAAGKGINFTMRDIDLASPGDYCLNFSTPENDYRLQQIQLSERLIASLVHEGHRKLAIRAFSSAAHMP